jgi:FHS family glucose/mannose:H+ symporter-like MFS transporter
VAVTFLLMGALAAAYGPLLEHLARRFRLDLPTVGGVFGAHFGGALVGVLVAMWTLERVPARIALWAGVVLLGLGCAGVALATSWPALLAAVSVIGVGFGALDLALNQLVAYSVSARRSALLNVLNGAYGIGAVVAPILVSAAGDRHALTMYAAAAALAAGVLFPLRGVSGRLPGPAGGTGTAGAAGWSALVALFAAAYVLYVGTETGTGGWMATHLEALGYPSTAAARLTSGFWLALAVGRLAVAPLTLRVREPVIVLASTALAAAALLAALAAPAAPAAYVVAGLAIAPIFPTGIVWLARLNRSPRATAWLFPASMAGGVLVPAGIGVAIGRLGVVWVPPILAAVALGTLAAFAAAARTSVK